MPVNYVNWTLILNILYIGEKKRLQGSNAKSKSTQFRLIQLFNFMPGHFDGPSFSCPSFSILHSRPWWSVHVFCNIFVCCHWKLSFFRFCVPCSNCVCFVSFSPVDNGKEQQVIWAKLMRLAKAYSSSCSQVIVVYLHPFRRNSLFCSQKSPKNRLKSIFLGFRVVQGHRCW